MVIENQTHHMQHVNWQFEYLINGCLNTSMISLKISNKQHDLQNLLCKKMSFYYGASYTSRINKSFAKLYHTLVFNPLQLSQ